MVALTERILGGPMWALGGPWDPPTGLVSKRPGVLCDASGPGLGVIDPLCPLNMLHIPRLPVQTSPKKDPVVSLGFSPGFAPTIRRADAFQ